MDKSLNKVFLWIHMVNLIKPYAILLRPIGIPHSLRRLPSHVSQGQFALNSFVQPIHEVECQSCSNAGSLPLGKNSIRLSRLVCPIQLQFYCSFFQPGLRLILTSSSLHPCVQNLCCLLLWPLNVLNHFFTIICQTLC